MAITELDINSPEGNRSIRDPERVGQLYFTWALDDYHKSKTVTAARVTLFAKKLDTPPDRLGAVFLASDHLVQEVSDRTVYGYSRIPSMTPDAIRRLGKNVFDLSQRLTELDDGLLWKIISYYPILAKGSAHVNETFLCRQANLMLEEQKNSGSRKNWKRQLALVG